MNDPATPPHTGRPAGRDTFVAVDGRDTLAFVIVRPGSTDGSVAVESSARGLSKTNAAHILRQVADMWDKEAGRD
ncbi:hypothetical protein [Streptomyces synnematoformans]|uniref:Uncharacterized protein n=1 Tax=Streptomyces synnematoformans TaxID=415721 RepID=A0ABN2XAE7_9ACTN